MSAPTQLGEPLATCPRLKSCGEIVQLRVDPVKTNDICYTTQHSTPTADSMVTVGAVLHGKV